MWENLIYDSEPTVAKVYGKNSFGSLAAIALFAGLYLLSATTALFMTVQLPLSLPFQPASKWAISVFNCLLAIGAMVFFFLKLYAIRKRSRGPVLEVGQLPAAAAADLILPCFNEVGALPWISIRVPTGLKPVVVDNNSSDNSASVATLLKFLWLLVRHKASVRLQRRASCRRSVI